jgi:HEAT repeat protein
VRKLAQDDPETRVRGSAYLTLQDAENPGQFVRVFKKGLSDSSYYVVRQALSALSNVNQKLALKASKALKQTRNDRLLLAVGRLHASQGQKAANSFLQDALLKRPNWRGRFNFFETYLGYLKRMGVSFFESELAELSDLEQWIADKDDRSSVVEALKSYRQDYQQELEELKAATDEKNEPIEQRERVIGRLNQMIETFQRPS